MKSGYPFSDPSGRASLEDVKMSDHDDDQRRRPYAEPRDPRTPEHLLDDLTERATPIDFPDLERRGVLQKVPHEKGRWCGLR